LYLCNTKLKKKEGEGEIILVHDNKNIRPVMITMLSKLQKGSLQANAIVFVQWAEIFFAPPF